MKITPIGQELPRLSLEEIKQRMELSNEEPITAIGGFVFSDEYDLEYECAKFKKSLK